VSLRRGWGFVVPDVEIATGYVPGAIGRIAELHGRYYHEHWQFGVFFEAKVATELAEFLARYDGRRDRFWTVSLADSIEGSVTIDGIHADRDGAHLRWFIVSDALRGRGIGNRLMDAAVDFCRARGYRKVHLWTFAGLNAARHLYEKAGFQLVDERRGAQWGTETTEQRFELRFS
jgi:GNAT superfamily N-acetyltransferase